MISHFTSSDGLRIAYCVRGSGQPVLCLSGLTRTMRDFDEVAVAFPDAQVIAMDYRGRGQSDWDPNWPNYDPAIEGRDALELLDHLGIARAAIIGTSRGGVIAMGLAAIAKARLSGVMLVDIGPELERGGLDLIADYVGTNPPYADFTEAELAMPEVCPGFANVSAGRWAREVRKYWRETDTGLKIHYDPKLRDAVTAALSLPPADAWPYFHALDGLPLGLIWGVNSNLLSARVVEKMRASRPDLILARVPDRGHVPFLDEAESLAALKTFLEATK